MKLRDGESSSAFWSRFSRTELARDLSFYAGLPRLPAMTEPTPVVALIHVLETLDLPDPEAVDDADPLPQI